MAVAIAATRERREGETRCAVTPETVKKLIALGATVTVEAGIGQGSSIPDADYAPAAATVMPDRMMERRERIIVYLRRKTGLAKSIASACPGLSARVIACSISGVIASARIRGASLRASTRSPIRPAIRLAISTRCISAADPAQVATRSS